MIYIILHSNYTTMVNGIALGVFMVILLIIGAFVLTLLINAFLVPLFKTPKDVLEEIVNLMELGESDHVVDLGSGDGRILLKAHKYSGCKCTGYDISPIMLIIARTRRLLQFPLSKDFVFEAEDIFKADLSNFTKIYCYLDEKSMDILNQKFLDFVNKGGEIYSFKYKVEGYTGERRVVLKNGENLYIYRV